MTQKEKEREREIEPRRAKQLPLAPDRRTDMRLKVSAVVVVRDVESSRVVEGRLSDLGKRGAYVDTKTPFELGSEVDVEITKGDKTFCAAARVVFSRDGKGMGLFFTKIEPDYRPVLDGWISSSLEISWLTTNRRRSQRILVKTSVELVAKEGKPFEEETTTEAISAHGALVLLRNTAEKGQRLTLRNKRTGAALECIVAYLGDRRQGEYLPVGVSFILPNAGFWHVAFPPPDWTPKHVDAKRS